MPRAQFNSRAGGISSDESMAQQEVNELLREESLGKLVHLLYSGSQTLLSLYAVKKRELLSTFQSRSSSGILLPRY